MSRFFPIAMLFLLAGLTVSGLASVAFADTITFSGAIIQSTGDGTGPAVNNPTLNNIQDLQAYLVTLVFAGSISAPGNYDLTGANLTLSDPAAPAIETSFDMVKLSITANAGFDDFSLLGCLTTGSGCLFGNELDANFRIPSAGLNSQNVAATGLDQPHPLDLLEDDGITDIHGTITTYSNSAAASVPEPSTAVLLGGVLAGLAATKAIGGKSKREKNI
jgi:hypothetical protein